MDPRLVSIGFKSDIDSKVSDITWRKSIIVMEQRKAMEQKWKYESTNTSHSPVSYNNGSKTPPNSEKSEDFKPITVSPYSNKKGLQVPPVNSKSEEKVSISKSYQDINPFELLCNS